MSFFWLAVGIIAEVIGSSLLKITNGFKRILPTLGVILAYSIAFYTLSLALREIPLGVTYAIWAGAGTALTAIVSVIFYKEMINGKKTLGILFIVGGVVLLNSGL